MAGARTADSKPQAAGAANANSKDVVDGGQDENVYLFIPNLIGYLRIVLAFGSLYEMPSHPRTCSLLYSISCLLDAFDGYAARRYNQATRFGVVLDMVTDRCTSASLLAFLASVFPRWTIVFQGLIVLDMASHYAHMYATLALGDSDHKRVAQSSSWIMRVYYNNKVVLFTLCALNEIFFIALYLLSFSSPYLSPELLQQIPDNTAGAHAPSSPLKAFLNPHSAAAFELRRSNKMDSTVPWIVAAISLLGMLLKQWINVVQLAEAADRLVQEDKRIRRSKGIRSEKKKA